VSSYVVPNVGTMTSTGLTAQQMSILFQNITLQCLGITPSGPTDQQAYFNVRIDWPTAGQPAWAITDDIAFLRCAEVQDRYNTAHEVQPVTQEPPTYPETTIYTRVWQTDFIFYGPNSFDRARQVKACLYQDFVHAILEASNLYLDTVIGTPRRKPELFQNQWWERTGFSARMNEQVTDVLVKPAIQLANIILEDVNGIFAEITVDL